MVDSLLTTPVGRVGRLAHWAQGGSRDEDLLLRPYGCAVLLKLLLCTSPA
jgi:hypothetical protein